MPAVLLGGRGKRHRHRLGLFRRLERSGRNGPAIRSRARRLPISDGHPKFRVRVNGALAVNRKQIHEDTGECPKPIPPFSRPVKLFLGQGPVSRHFLRCIYRGLRRTSSGPINSSKVCEACTMLFPGLPIKAAAIMTMAAMRKSEPRARFV